MLKAIAPNWNDELILEQIKWVEKCYYTLSTFIYQCKQKLIGILHLDFASNLKLNTAKQGI